MARIVKLIYTEERAGMGTEESPVRLCPQLWNGDGLLVAMLDPVSGVATFVPERINTKETLSDID